MMGLLYIPQWLYFKREKAAIEEILEESLHSTMVIFQEGGPDDTRKVHRSLHSTMVIFQGIGCKPCYMGHKRLYIPQWLYFKLDAGAVGQNAHYPLHSTMVIFQAFFMKQ